MRSTGKDNADRNVHPTWEVHVRLKVTVAGASWLERHRAGQPKHAGEKHSSEPHFHTLHTPSTCIVQKSLKPKQAISHDVTKAAGHNKQEGGWRLQRCLDSWISVTAVRDKADAYEFSGRRPRIGFFDRQSS